MSSNNNNIMEKAEARFLETQKKAAERSKATAEYMSEAKARAVKTAKLRDLRLAKGELRPRRCGAASGEAKDEASAAYRQRQDGSFPRRQPDSRVATARPEFVVDRSSTHITNGSHVAHFGLRCRLVGRSSLAAETRRLAAILAADIAGYSRLMAADEAGTLARLKSMRAESVEPAIASFGGNHHRSGRRQLACRVRQCGQGCRLRRQYPDSACGRQRRIAR